MIRVANGCEGDLRSCIWEKLSVDLYALTGCSQRSVPGCAPRMLALYVVHSWWLLALCVGCCFTVACLGLCLWVQARSSDCLAAEVQSWWCRQSVGGTVQLLVVIACSWVLYDGSSSVVKLLGGRGAVMLVLSRLLMAPCLLLRCDCVLIGLCVRGSCSVVIDCRPRAVTLMRSY